MSGGRASLGANWSNEATTFEVWAPDTRRAELLLLEPASGSPALHLMESAPEGYFTLTLPDAPPGTLYRFRLDGRGPFPDPVSRFQPFGVHGPSQVVDPAAFGWTDAAHRARALDDTILYELHVGTFTPAGTFRSAIERLPALRELGVTTLELMPVADFPGERNWGYDGAAWFAPARCYGTPDDLRALVDAAHAEGLDVHLDVVYNHFGPDGAYQSSVSPQYVSREHRSPWGDTLNFDGPGSRAVRDYVVENALRWIREYHVDGLRLDATHAIVDHSPLPIVAELTGAVQDAAGARGVLVIAEDARNLRRVVEPVAHHGWAAAGVWSDDFHHQMRRGLAGDHDGYFADFTGSSTDIAATARQGWYFQGQPAPYFGGARGSDSRGLPYSRFICFLQNHDQIGNRAFGDRLHHSIDLAAWRAASVLLLLLPETPLLFMGQEWGASTPFQFFTDHPAELGRAVTQGRRDEFRGFTAFRDPASRARIPDPQDPATFRASTLNWEESRREPHASLLRLSHRLLQLRRTEPALRSRGAVPAFDVEAWDDDVIVLRRGTESGPALLAIVRLRGAGDVDLREHPFGRTAAPGGWVTRLTSEDPRFATDPRAPELFPGELRAGFARPGAVLFATRDR